MSRPTFDTYGVGPWYLNRRSGEPVEIIERTGTAIDSGETVGTYRVRFPDGYTADAFGTELAFVSDEQGAAA